MQLVFTEALLVVFLTLKLTGVITWSWWWVFSPVWIPIVILMVVWLLIELFTIH